MSAPGREPQGRIGVASVLLAVGLAVALLWPPAPAARALEGASRAAAVWTPFVALAGLPLGGAARRWPLLLAAALPPAALAAGLDRAAGIEAARLVATAVAGALLVGVLGEARARAARAGSPLHAWLWLAAVPLPPVLATALAWGAGDALTREGLPGRLWRSSPVGALWAEVRPGAGAAAEGLLGALALPAVPIALALLAAAVWLELRPGRGA